MLSEALHPGLEPRTTETVAVHTNNEPNEAVAKSVFGKTNNKCGQRITYF